MRYLLLLGALSAVLPAQSPDPAYPVLEKAYEQLRLRDYEEATGLFRKAAALSPTRADIRKNLAYTLLKIGETEAARDAFAEAMRLDPADHHVALEYAFLCHETGQTRQARLVFDRVRKNGDPASRQTAEQGFRSIDAPLAEGIARWRQAVEREPGNFSAHHELARLAEQRNDWPLAAEHYQHCWRIKPSERSVLLDLGRAWKEVGRKEDSFAALLAASRGAQARVADTARQLLGSRYPYVYEFRHALTLDPSNVELRRELAYLLLEMGQRAEAETEFGRIVEAAPDDLLSAAQLGFLRLQHKDTETAMPLLERVLKSDEDELADRVRSALQLPRQLRKRPEVPRRRISEEARAMAEKSYQAGYLKDALKYLTIAHEADPVDFDIMLKLGFTNNLLKRDKEATDWFRMARYSPDPSVAAEAHRAYTNLSPQFRKSQTTAWLLPFYSSRWKDVFSYGQVKTEFRAGTLPLRPYLSMRFIGDTRGEVRQPFPQYLSEKSFILGAGLRTPAYKGWMGWAEAGQAVSYHRQAGQSSRTQPDYRGGISFSRGFGHLLGAERPGPFFENHEDAVYVSRFNRSLLLYTQNKAGYTLPPAAGLRVQLYWNVNLTADARQQYWANFAETGPGVRMRWPSMPEAMVFSIDMVRGAHTINQGNPRRPNYYDVRAGFWYAFAK